MSDVCSIPVSLDSLPEGAVCTLIKWGSLSEEDIRKLTDVGILLDTPLVVSSKTISGPVVIAVNDAHIAISSETAKQLIVLVRND